jgi:Tol biopolymer transport system component
MHSRTVAAAALSLLAASAFALCQDEAADKKSDEKKGLPLEPERKIEFETDEGTWLSLDIAPDGKTIVFELLGDLYTLPIEGGVAKPLTTGMAFDSQPRYSPDGNWLAFLSDRDGAENVWIAKADGSQPKPLSQDKQSSFASPAWSSDGEYVIVSRNQPGLRTFELWMYHVRGGSGVQITKAKPKPDTPNDQQHNALGAVASPDGRHLYYARKLGGFAYNVNFPLWQVARRDLKTGDEDILTQAEGSAIRPTLSRDGRRLVYGTRHDTETGLRIRDLETGDDRWLRYPVQRDDQESRFTRDLLPGLAFTPDGQALIASIGGKIQRVDVATGAARVIPFTAKVAQDLGPKLEFPARVDEAPVKARLIQAPVLSPDGKRLAFSSLTRLYAMAVPGGAPARLTGGDAREYQPAWSPDGQWLAYVTWSSEGGHVVKLRADGKGAPQQLTRVPAYYRDPVWTPDGTRLVALRAARQARVHMQSEFGGGGPRGMDLVWIPATGGDATLVVPARGGGRPHFAAEKERIYVYSSDGLVSLRFDGTDRRTHVKIVGKGQGPEPTPASDVRISPDGRYALALVHTQLYLVSIPVVGGEPPTVNVSSPNVPVKKLTDVGADYFAWADGGRTLTWALGSSFFRQPLSSVSFEAPQPGSTEKKEGAAEPKADEKPGYEEIAVTIERPRQRPKGTVVLRGARIISMRGDEVIENADLVVADNRIASVGARGAVPLPAHAHVIDVSGKTIMPGMIDVHAHWMEIRKGVLDLPAWPFLANLAYGITTGRDPQTATNDTFAYQDLIDLGETIGPRAFSTGPGVFANSDFQSSKEAKSVVAKYKKYYRTNTLKSYLVGNRRQRQLMVEACKEHGIMPTTEGALDLKLDLTHVIDGMSGNEHAIPIVPLYKDVVELVARSGLFYTPTLLVAYGGPWAENYYYQTTEVHDDPKLRRFVPHNILDARALRRPWFRENEHVFSKLAQAAAKIVRAGGRVLIGGHGQLQGIQCHWELWALQSGGLTNMEALRAATLHGAEAIGYAQDLGSLEKGKLADLIVLDRNPLENIRNTTAIRYVMKDGELFEGATLDKIWPERKPLPPLWWWNEEPAQAAPSTDVFVAELRGRGAKLSVGAPTNVSAREGYDNQPSFAPNGRPSLYYTVGENGQTDIYEYDFAKQARTRVRHTTESEYSPTVTPDGKGLSVIRVEADRAQRLWRLPLDGGAPELILPDVKPVGYHAWADEHTVALFVLGSPPTLQLADTRTGKADIIEKNVGRSLHKVPGRAAISFVHKVSDSEWWIKQLDVATRAVKPLVRTLNGSEDYAWTPAGVLLMANGGTLHACEPGRDARWRAIARFGDGALQKVTRLAVSPSGDRLALVSEAPR